MSVAPFVIDTHELGRQPGAERDITLEEPAPEELTLEMIGVPQDSPVRISGRIEAVMEGVLASGDIDVDIHGSCVRCLESIDFPWSVDFAELFVYDDRPAEDDESRLVGDLLDLETVIRDAVLLDLPTNPLCDEDCKGLCPECGVNLNADPDHAHDDPIDPRWSALQSLADETASAGDATPRDDDDR